jgi:hypothetical protein
MLALALKPTVTHLRLMTDKPDSRDADTLAPDTDRAGRDTEPPDAVEDAKATRALQTLLPQRQLSEPVKEMAIDQLLRMYEDARKREHDLLDADGKLARLADERAQRIKQETVDELAAVVDRLAGQPVQELSQTVARLAEAMQAERAKNAEQDDRIAAIEKLVADLKTELLEVIQRETTSAAQKIEALEQLIHDLKANATRAPQSQSPG